MNVAHENTLNNHDFYDKGWKAIAHIRYQDKIL
jgi:hypothetical protein